MPFLSSALTAEREKRQYQILHISGVHPLAYWLAAYVHHFRVMCLWGLFFVLLNYAAGAWPFAIASPGHYVLAVCVVWPHAATGVSVFVSALTNTARSATILAFMVVLATVIVGPVMALTYHTQTADPWPTAMMWLPPLAYARMLAILLQYRGLGFGVTDSELSRVTGLCFLFGTAFGVVGWYLVTIRFRPPFWIFNLCRRDAQRKTRGTQNALSGGGGGGGGANNDDGGAKSSGVGDSAAGGGAAGSSAVGSSAAADDDHVVVEDEDVAAERVRVSTAAAETLGVRIENLRKEYAPSGQRKRPKVAVEGLTLGVAYGESRDGRGLRRDG
jgi:hypothetical protein